MQIHIVYPNLAISQRGKEKTFKNPAIFWQPAGMYGLNMAILERPFIIEPPLQI
jgi:hypothetical protein